MNIVEVTYRWAKPLYRRSATDYIIIHHEAGSGQTPQSIHAQHIAQGWAGIGYHYYVRKDGTVYRCKRDDTGSGTALYYTISQLVGDYFEAVTV